MKLLVLLSRFPFPLDKGDKLRAFHQLRYLAERHNICLFALTDEDVPAAAMAAVQPLCRGGLVVHRLHRPAIARNMARALATGKPLQIGYFYDPAAQLLLKQLLQNFEPEHIYCQLIRMAEYLRPLTGRVPMTLDYMDVFSAGMARRATQAPPWQRPLWALEARRLRAYEAEVFAWFRHHTIISDQDRQLIAHPDRAQIHLVLNGIDTDFFQPRPAAPKEYDLLFCGNMAYPPNVDAACFLVEVVLPLVQQTHPAARLLVAGTTPVARVQALASAAVTVSGWVPDIRAAYASARVFVAPMRVGTGLQNKLLEAMAMALPCVTTTLANNALGGQPGRDLMVENQPERLAATIVALLDAPDAASALARRGQEFAKSNFDWGAATDKLNRLFDVS